MIGIIVAVPRVSDDVFECLSNGVIGKDGKLPWSHKGDLKRFKEVTLDSTVIMGKRTWDSIGARALPGRRNVVLSSKASWWWEPGIQTFTSTDQALRATSWLGDVWLIGGHQVYEDGLRYADVIDVTLVPDKKVVGDVLFPSFNFDEWGIRFHGVAASDHHITMETTAAHPHNPDLRVARLERKR